LTQIFGLCAPISVHMYAYLFKAKVSQGFVCFERVIIHSDMLLCYMRMTQIDLIPLNAVTVYQKYVV